MTPLPDSALSESERDLAVYCPVGPQCARLRRQISLANRERSSGAVARIISTAAGTVMESDSPFMLVTASAHCG